MFHTICLTYLAFLYQPPCCHYSSNFFFGLVLLFCISIIMLQNTERKLFHHNSLCVSFADSNMSLAGVQNLLRPKKFITRLFWLYQQNHFYSQKNDDILDLEGSRLQLAIFSHYHCDSSHAFTIVGNYCRISTSDSIK